jgi:hypothetical protein
MNDPHGPPPMPAEYRLAKRAWELMGGLDWTALPLVAEMLGVKDVESLVHQLVTVRDHLNRN